METYVLHMKRADETSGESQRSPQRGSSMRCTISPSRSSGKRAEPVQSSLCSRMLARLRSQCTTQNVVLAALAAQ